MDEKSFVFSGFLNVFKPPGLTSHDVVNKLRRLTRLKRIGHCGTLDPMATGVLPIALGNACRLIQYLRTDKVYLAEILLGMRTTTDDVMGEIVEERDLTACKNLVDEERIKESLAKMSGEQNQTPPNFSAIHYQGKRLYELAREGRLPDAEAIKPRRVTIETIEVLAVDVTADDTNGTQCTVRARIACSGGTYIRSIARDLGDMLGVGGCLKSLLREQSGPFKLEKSDIIDDLTRSMEQDEFHLKLIDPLKCLDLPFVQVDETAAKKLSMGQRIDASGIKMGSKDWESLLGGADQISLNGENRSLDDSASRNLAILALEGDRLVAVCEVEPGPRLHAKVVLSKCS